MAGWKKKRGPIKMHDTIFKVHILTVYRLRVSCLPTAVELTVLTVLRKEKYETT